MTAQTLRDAAKVLRERAGAATPGPWHTDGPFWVDPPGKPISEETVETRSGVTGAHRTLVMAGTWESNDFDPDYIATMHPGVGLALADWLDAEFGHEFGPPEQAITVARAILGGDA